MNAPDFIQKWRKVQLTERAASQEHFLDLCALLGHPSPAAADPEGASFTFERGAAKRGGGDGWADVWKKGFFGWEYKGKHKDLDAAYAQLLQYHEALDNPPLLVACDMDRMVVHTKFSGFPTTAHEIALDDLASAKGLDLLRAVFFDVERLRPERPDNAVTEEAARHIAELAQGLRNRGLEPHAVARFLDRIVFCLFAEDVGLLPQGLFSRIVERTRDDPPRFSRMLAQLFEAMAHGGDFGMESIPHFNGDLFLPVGGASLPREERDRGPETARPQPQPAGGPAMELTAGEIEAVYAATRLDWSAIQPSIFGTLFERGLDPSKRSQLGAHYTSREDIVTLVEPVVMQPLRREWHELRATLDSLLASGKKPPVCSAGFSPSLPAATSGSLVAQPRPEGRTTNVKTLRGAALKKARDEAAALVNRFRIRLSQVKVLDPACGSGNFLYVTLQLLKDLEKAVITYAADHDLGSFFPYVLPTQLYGIEINPYAFELAQMTVWIGHLQWNRNNGFDTRETPILRPMRNFECKDAILDVRSAGFSPSPGEAKIPPEGGTTNALIPHVVPPLGGASSSAPSPPPRPPEGRTTNQEGPPEGGTTYAEPEWPRVDFIVGNPPFLGGNKVRQELGDEYVEALFRVYEGRVPPFADLCCYWFEKARKQIEEGKCRRAGLLATQGIRGGANREVLKGIKATGGIFFAQSDRPWVLDGANVHVSMVAFDTGQEKAISLDGRAVPLINPNLTAVADVTTACAVRSSLGVCFMGPSAKAPFDIPESLAVQMLRAGGNVHGLPNSDVIRRVASAVDLVKKDRSVWTIDFGSMAEEVASLYEAPFEYARKVVYPLRAENPRQTNKNWWQYERPRVDMRRALSDVPRFASTPGVAKHRIFVWRGPEVLCNQGTLVFARSDDYFFGLLHSRLHEVWALRLGTRLETRPRYTPTTCFETFPFPRPTPEQEAAIGEAARELNELREAWLNPPEWTRTEVLEFPGTVGGPWTRYIVPESVGGASVPRVSASPSSRGTEPPPTAETPRPQVGVGLVRYPRLVPRDGECAAKLKARTLTNLYNERPTWLDLAHRRLDAAVFAAYGWDAAMGNEEILEKLLALNLERAAAESAGQCFGAWHP
ncbi:MAG: class I SAM-dependent DNA methyltransferase [Planctomycetes bacterium]|nr:class I SAM-dependent DNA methyltransferase [Planctomycetota bacterium]